MPQRRDNVGTVPMLSPSSTWSTSMTSIICLFELVHLNDLLFDKLVDDVVFVTPLTIAKTV